MPNATWDVSLYQIQYPDLNLTRMPPEDGQYRTFTFSFSFRYMQWAAYSMTDQLGHLVTDAQLWEYLLDRCYELTDLTHAFSVEMWYQEKNRVFTVQFLIAD